MSNTEILPGAQIMVCVSGTRHAIVVRVTAKRMLVKYSTRRRDEVLRWFRLADERIVDAKAREFGVWRAGQAWDRCDCASCVKVNELIAYNAQITRWADAHKLQGCQPDTLGSWSPMIEADHAAAFAIDPTARPCDTCKAERRVETTAPGLAHLGARCLDASRITPEGTARGARLMRHRDCGHEVLNATVMDTCERAEADAMWNAPNVIRPLPGETPAEMIERGAKAFGIDLNAAPAVVAVDGGGSGQCDTCGGQLDYSWRVTLADGTRGTRCSRCLDTSPGVAAEIVRAHVDCGHSIDVPAIEACEAAARAELAGMAIAHRECGHARNHESYAECEAAARAELADMALGDRFIARHAGHGHADEAAAIECDTDAADAMDRERESEHFDTLDADGMTRRTYICTLGGADRIRIRTYRRSDASSYGGPNLATFERLDEARAELARMRAVADTDAMGTLGLDAAWDHALIERCKRLGHHHSHTVVAGKLAAEILLCYLDSFHGLRVVVDTAAGPLVGTVSHMMMPGYGGAVVRTEAWGRAPRSIPWSHLQPLAPGADLAAGDAVMAEALVANARHMVTAP